MKSTSGSMSRSMSLSRTVSSDRSMSIEDVLRRRHQNNVKYNKEEDEHKSNSRDKESRYRRSYSRSSSRRRSTSSSESYNKYKNYKNFRKGKYSRSLSSSRSYSRSSTRRRSISRSYSYSSTSSSRRSSIDSKSSISRSRSRTPRYLRRRNELHRNPDRRLIRERRNSKDRNRGGRIQERRNLTRKSLRDKPRLEDKFNFEDEPRLNGRNRINERLNGFRKVTNREIRKEFKVDRKYNTPFLLKVFANGINENIEQTNEPEELHVYAWLDNTLRDLVNLIKDISPPTRNRSNTWIFSTNKGKDSIELGNVHCFKPNSREDNRTLESLKFEIGSSLKLTFKD